MKFIREIISGKQDGAHRPGRDDPAARPAQGRGPALDLDRYSLATPADKSASAAPVKRSENDEDLCRKVSEARWMRSERSNLTRDLAEAIRAPAPETRKPLPVLDLSEEDETDEDVRGTGEADPADDAYEPIALTGDDESDDDEVLYFRDDADEESDDRIQDDMADADDCAEEDMADAHDAEGDADEWDASAEDDDAGPFDAIVAERPEPVRRPEPARTAVRRPPDPDDDRLRDMIRAAAPSEQGHTPRRPVTEFRDLRKDPFNRLDKMAETAPVQDVPSPFQRQKDRPQEAQATTRPRTRLAENLSMPLPDAFEIPSPAAGRAARREGRVKTRLLGFGGGDDRNPFEAAPEKPVSPDATSMFPVGWLVVVAGPGRGNAFTIFNGVSQIGRGEDQAVRLDFGDTSISRSNHAAVAYDKEQQKFYLGHGGKANLVRMNGKPVLSTEELQSGAVIHIGESKLKFVALCGAGFDWDKNHHEDVDAAIFG